MTKVVYLLKTVRRTFKNAMYSWQLKFWNSEHIHNNSVL